MIGEGAMVRGILDGPPEPTELESWIAHGKLLVTALYAPDLRKRGAARAAITRLLRMADDD
jgi:hypothetical protein